MDSCVLHPFYNEQRIWLSQASDEMREWLENPDCQERFVVGERPAEGGDATISNIPCTPIEVAINAYLYGWSAWLRSSEATEDYVVVLLVSEIQISPS
jgi:hypothetical protein